MVELSIPQGFHVYSYFVSICCCATPWGSYNVNKSKLFYKHMIEPAARPYGFGTAKLFFQLSLVGYLKIE